MQAQQSAALHAKQAAAARAELEDVRLRAADAIRGSSPTGEQLAELERLRLLLRRTPNGSPSGDGGNGGDAGAHLNHVDETSELRARAAALKAELEGERQARAAAGGLLQ